MSLQDIKSVRDEHIKKLVTRCKNLRILDLKGTSISDESITTIIEQLKPTLEELDVSHTGIYFAKLLGLSVMPKLRVLHCWNLKPDEISIVKNSLANVKINYFYLEVADSEQTFEPEDGIWDIKSNQIELPDREPSYDSDSSSSNELSDEFSSLDL